MQYIAVGRLLRMVRVRHEWRQSDVAARAGISASVVARHERGMINSLAMLDHHASALDLRLDMRLLARSGQLVRMADEEHAAIVESIADWLRGAGFHVEAEASFSEWGERGRIDLLAYDPRTRTVVIVEVKTLLLDLQELLGSLDVRERLVAVIARRRGWSVEHRVTARAVAASAANRSVVRTHPALFQPFTVRRLGLPAFSTRSAAHLDCAAADGQDHLGGGKGASAAVLGVIASRGCLSRSGSPARPIWVRICPYRDT